MRFGKREVVVSAAVSALVALVLSLLSCINVPPPLPQSPTNLFVGGTIIAVVGPTANGKAKEVALPHASVYLVPFGDRAHPVASTLSDLSGRFILKTTKSGVFSLCVEADGFLVGGRGDCDSREFSMRSVNVSFGNIKLAPKQDDLGASLFGTVRLRDGHMPRGFFPLLGVNAYSTVMLLNSAGNTAYTGYVNNFGEYVIPRVPVRDKFTVRYSIDQEVLDQDIDPVMALAPHKAYELDTILANSAPRIRALTATSGGKPIQNVPLGSQVALHAVSEDPNGDSLQYRWLLPDGSTVGPTANRDLTWTVPNSQQRFAFTVVVSDRRGGYAQNGISIDASSQRATFSGTVVDPVGNPIEDAQVDVNGRLISTNSSGRFSYDVPLADRYVMNIRKPGIASPNLPAFGTASFIYQASVTGSRWTLRRAEVTTVDPTKPIVLQQKRSEIDCPTPATMKIDWTPYMNSGLFDWQDGRGNSRALTDIGESNPKNVQNLMLLLARVNPALVQYLSTSSGVGKLSDDRRLTCGPGIKVEIPPNSLVATGTNQPPAGNIQIALSTVALTVGDQMPGDYTVIDPGNNVSAMESFGAGSIEIGSGAQRYNLKPGATATVTLPVDTTQLSGGVAPKPTIPIFHYDELKGVWQPEGQATLTGTGLNAAYKAKVSHFSTINSDIQKVGQSCVAVEVDSSLSSLMPFQVEVVMQPSVVNPGVIQVRQDLTVNTLRTNAIYNLPNDKDIVLTPIIAGTLPDGSTGNVPAGVFVVNTGGPQVGGAGAPIAKSDGSYYAESNGVATGPCASRVTLKKLNPPVLQGTDEFLQGFSFQSSNLTEFSAVVVAAIESGATDYYMYADARNLRNSFTKFKDKNRFGQPLAAGEVEQDAQYANSGDLGFGRDMHCRRNVASDGQFDYACYVTNFGQPPLFLPDQQDADDTADPNKADATVAMEFSRVENPLSDPNEFFNNDRAVKFYVYDTKKPDDTTRIVKADLDGHGARPVPQLCMVCHGGNLASVAADPQNPTGPKKGAFADRTDIVSMHSNFLPFDLHLFSYPAAKSKLSQQTAFKKLNTDIVRGVSAANPNNSGTAIVEVIDIAFYPGGSATQKEFDVIAGWDPGNVNSNTHKLYQNVIARACRTCHIARPFNAPSFSTKGDFDMLIGSIQDKACVRKIMPHAQRTNDVFWQSLSPNMPAFLELYGQTVLGWATGGAASCGLFYQPGTIAVSQFQSQVLPVLQTKCNACHSQPGLANFGVGQPPNVVYNELLNNFAKAPNGSAHYIVSQNPGASKLYERISSGPNGLGARMPQSANGPYLDATDTVVGGAFDQQEILNWINAKAVGP
jgi:hypothetical protein